MRKLISFDWAIKRILRDKANFVILEGFLSELLSESITIVELLESESNQDGRDDKSNRLDIKVKNQKNELILIEIQYSSELDYMQRILYATSKAITEHIKKGAPYTEVSKIISISILYFDFGTGEDYIYKGTTSFVGLHSRKQLRLNSIEQDLYKTDRIENIYPEYYLLKVKNFPGILTGDPLDEWMLFLKEEKIPETPRAKGLREAMEELEYLKMDDRERIEYDRYQENRHYEASMYESTYVVGKKRGHKEGRKEGLEEGREKGLKEGRKEERMEIAKTAIRQGLDNETIKTLTGLTDSQLAELK